MYLIFSELFPEKYKYKLNSIGYAFNWVACILSVFMLDWFLNGTEYIIYFIFAFVTLVLGLSGTYLCPETLNRTLTDIEEEIKKWGVQKPEYLNNEIIQSDDDNEGFKNDIPKGT